MRAVGSDGVVGLNGMPRLGFVLIVFCKTPWRGFAFLICL